MLALLSLDSYNRGYLPGIAGLGGILSELGHATLITDSETTSSTSATAQAAGFYASAYSYNGQTIIAYRGSDDRFLDPLFGYGTGAGYATGDTTAQSELAV
jgi:hypothetical protein